MPTLQDLDNLLSHPLSNPRDAKGLLEEEEAEARRKGEKMGGRESAVGKLISLADILSKSLSGWWATDSCVKLGHS